MARRSFKTCSWLDKSFVLAVALAMLALAGQVTARRIPCDSSEIYGTETRDVVDCRGKEEGNGDFIDTYEGDDLVLAANKMNYGAEVNAGPGNDVVKGGAMIDTLLGGEGDDKLIGGGLGDVLSGGDGNDKLVGNSGDDVLYGYDGNDVIFAGTGADVADGGNGADNLNGSTGDDILSGGRGNDIVKGGGGDDIISGGVGNDNLLGENGNDVITLGRGRDGANGGKGNDTIFDDNSINNGDLPDKMLGGDGDDKFVLTYGRDVPIKAEVGIDGGRGTDTLVLQVVDPKAVVVIQNKKVLKPNNSGIVAVPVAAKPVRVTIDSQLIARRIINIERIVIEALP